MNLIEVSETDFYMNNIYRISRKYSFSHYDFYKVYKVTNKLIYLRKLGTNKFVVSNPTNHICYGFYKIIASDKFETNYKNEYTEKRLKISDIKNMPTCNEYDYECYAD